LEDSEETLLELHPAMFRSNPLGFVISVLLIAAVGIGLLILGWWWLETRAAELTITNKRTTQRTGLISKNTTEVLHRDVRNIQVSQSALQRIFGVGSLGISSAGQAGVEIQFSGVVDPDSVKALIDRHRGL
jgi:uncharacterized membrane protein YdbT with pleckstrin-like domain